MAALSKCVFAADLWDGAISWRVAPAGLDEHCKSAVPLYHPRNGDEGITGQSEQTWI
jgi:hypothetical protein